MSAAATRGTTIIINPQAAAGRTGRVWRQLRPRVEAALGPIDVFETRHAGHGSDLAAEALERGERKFVAIGGDGTLNEIVNGLFRSGIPDSDTTLGLIPLGTGSDFGRFLGLPSAPEAAIAVGRNGHTCRIDILRVQQRSGDGPPIERYGINLVSFGLGGQVAALAKGPVKRVAGRFAYLVATGVAAARHRGDRVVLELDGENPARRRITQVAIGNGRFHGGGMDACPLAVVDDGLMEVTRIDRLSLIEIARNLRILFNGRIYAHPKVHHDYARSLRARSDDTVLVEIDGEPFGTLPIEIQILGRALGFIVPAGH